MFTKRHFRWRNEKGYALLLTMAFLGISVVVLASIMGWTSNETALTARNNLYNSSVSAAEAATEMVLARMDRDFLYGSISANLTQYQNLTPSSVEGNWPTQFTFSDNAGNANETGVTCLGSATVANLNSQFTGLYGLVTPYLVTSRAQVSGGLYPVAAAVSQSVQFASIPIFQFAIFYGVDLEINPGATMVVTGKVHSNADLYSAPPASLTFNDDVTAVGQIIRHRNPNDPNGDGSGTVTFNKQDVSKVGALTLPIGITNGDPVAIRQVVDPPPPGGDTNAALAQQRYFNNADLIVSNSPSGAISVSAGKWDNFAPIVPDATNSLGVPSYSFVTNVSFYDYREGKQTLTTQIDVGKLKTWIASPTGGSVLNGLASFQLGHNLSSVYVNNTQTASGKLPAVRVANGAEMPTPSGLTVATDLPLYVLGNYNVKDDVGTSSGADTTHTRPASLVGDAITILSSSWNDTSYTSSTPLSSRTPVNTTVNAAFIGGIVESATVNGVKHYSGGVENFPRFLENWSGKTVTYNGSMVVLFPSQFATNFWVYGNPVYNAPNRNWAFDVNFLKQSGLPPCTPQVRKLVRGQWEVVAAN